MRTTPPLPFLGMVVLAPLLGSCFSSQAVEEHYYLLRSPEKALESGKGPKVLVNDFTASPGYDTPRIAYRVTENELRYYAYRKWAAEPARMLTEATIRHLRASGQFSVVAQGDKLREPDVVLEGNVDAIEEFDVEENVWKAHLAMTFYLRKAHSEKVLLRHAFDMSLPCARREVNEVADNMSKILAMELDRLAPKIAAAAAPLSSSSPDSAGPTSDAALP